MTTSRFFGNQRRTVIIVVVIAALVVGGLLLPPISVLERTGIVCMGNTLNADSPALTTPTGLTVALSDASHSLTFASIASARLRARIPCLPSDNAIPPSGSWPHLKCEGNVR